MRKVVQQQAAHRNLANIGEPCRHRQMVERRVFRMESQRNEGLKAACLVLQRAQFEQVIHAVFIVLDMPCLLYTSRCV